MLNNPVCRISILGCVGISSGKLNEINSIPVFLGYINSDAMQFETGAVKGNTHLVCII